MSELTNVRLKLLAAKKGVKFVWKEESWLMRLIAKILFFNKEFMTRYYTTIFSTVYTPEPGADLSDETLVHELVHACDFDSYGKITMAIFYLNPQFWGALFLLASPAIILLGIFWKPVVLILLIMIIFLAPIPASGRKWMEMRGYAATMAVLYWQGRFNELDDVEWIIKKFTGPDYYWMWPFELMVKEEIEEWIQKIHNDEILYEIPVLQEVKAILLPDEFSA